MNRLEFINEKGPKKVIEKKQEVVEKVKVDDYGPSPAVFTYSVPFISTEESRNRIGTIITNPQGQLFLIIDEKGTLQRLDPIIQG